VSISFYVSGTNKVVELCLAADDLSEEAQKEELLPIMVQQVYVLARQGKTEEAKKLCQSLPLAEYVE
jgi:signal recognition particle subunit SRP72